MNSELKADRIRMLKDARDKLVEVSHLYVKQSPAFVLLQSAWGHVNSLHHLEAETKFDEETLGVKFKHD